MEKGTIKEKLKEEEVRFFFDDEEDLFTLLDALTEVDEVIRVPVKSMKVHAITPETDSPITEKVKADESQIDTLKRNGGYVTETPLGFFKALDSTALQLAERGKINCRLLSEMIKNGRRDSAAEIINFGWEFADENDSAQLMLRAGNIIGVFSSIYQHRQQRKLFDAAAKAIKVKFPSMNFKQGEYTHEMTDVYYGATCASTSLKR